MDEQKYINRSNSQLSYERNYKTLQENPMLQLSKLVNTQLTDLKKSLLSTKMGGGLKSVNQKPQKYHISLKIHKGNNSGKPVI